MKLKSKFLILSILLILILLTSVCFATSSENIVTTSDNIELVSEQVQINTKNSDLYISNGFNYTIKDIINGNIFATVDNLDIDPNNGGTIQGDMFAIAKNVTIKSNATYSDTEKNEIGNPVLSVDKYSNIYGNVFVITDKFVLEPGCRINGDLYVIANKIELQQNAIVYGNVFAVSKEMYLNCEIDKDLYAASESFDMDYFGFILRDLHIDSENANLNGYVYRNSFISSKNITTNDKFINQENFNIKNSSNLNLSGEIKGNATINCKNINFDSEGKTCIIRGNLNYSSNKDLKLDNTIVLGEINYSDYKEINKSNKFLSKILDYILSLITLVVTVCIVYLITSKVMPDYLDKLSNVPISNLVKCLGLGFGFLILLPIVIILLLISTIGMTLAFILLLVYIIILILSKSIFVISISKLAKEKFNSKFNIYLYILATSIMLSLICLLPYIGAAISFLAFLTGLGIIIKNLIPNKK